MGRNTSITLGDHFSDFVDQQVENGRFGSASEVIRAGLRLLEEHEAEVSKLRQSLIDAENSGLPSALDIDAFLATKNAGLKT